MAVIFPNFGINEKLLPNIKGNKTNIFKNHWLNFKLTPLGGCKCILQFYICCALTYNFLHFCKMYIKQRTFTVLA